MSISPRKYQGQGSPTKYDSDFYQRKIVRLQADSNELIDELNKARVRLRRAQDFQLKYDMLYRQNINTLCQLDRKDKELSRVRAELQLQLTNSSQKLTQNEDYLKERSELQRQVEKWRVKAEEAEEKKLAYVMQVKEGASEQTRKEIEAVRLEFKEREAALLAELLQVKRGVLERESVEGVVSGRVERMKRDREAEQKKHMEEKEEYRKQHNAAIKSKEEEMNRLREKFEKLFNFQIENIKRTQEDQDGMFHLELNGFRELLQLKNDQISRLLGEITKQNVEFDGERDHLMQEISLLKDQLYRAERMSELELTNLKERLGVMHGAEMVSLQTNYNEIVQTLKNDKRQLERLVKEREKVIEAEKRETERHRGEVIEKLKERDQRIGVLEERIKRSGDQNQEEIKNLHQSFHHIESQKQLLATDYQSNVGFLNQQIAKLAVKNDANALTIVTLQQEISRIKRQNHEAIMKLEDHFKAQRKDYEEQRVAHRQKFEKYQQEQREMSRVYRAKQSQLQKSRDAEQREKEKIKFLLQETEKDTERLNNHIKHLDECLKRELKKNQTSTLDTGGLRRELAGDLQKQKIQMEAVKRMEVDQIRQKLNIQIDKLTHENEKLQTSLLTKTIALEKNQQQLKQLSHLNKQIQQINKDTLIDYQKKMATMNNEILLTQRLYDSFMQAKARQQH